MKTKTNTLTGPALDWAVATALGYTRSTIQGYNLFGSGPWKQPAPVGFWDEVDSPDGKFQPSTDWAQGGPIIEQEGIDIRQVKSRPFIHLDPRHFDVSKGDEIVRLPGWNRDLVQRPRKPYQDEGKWMARMSVQYTSFSWSVQKDFLSDTALQAAMRCYVASKLGDKVDVPEEFR